jgi:hypothetical protein
MKTRNGFVSNSSSSSFIVAVDPKFSGPCPHCGRSDDNIIERLRKLGECEDSQLRACGKTNVLDYADWLDREEFREVRDAVETYSAKGFEIAYIEIGNHDESLNDEYRAQVNSGKLVEIKNLDC